jgi:signal transduction histidine kinase
MPTGASWPTLLGMRPFLHRHGDAVLAIALATVAELELFLLHLDYERALFVPIMLLTPLALAWRTRFPLAVLGVHMAAWVLIDLYTPANEDPLTLGITLGIAVYSVGAHTRGPRAAVGAALVAGMALLATFVDWNQGSFVDLLGNLTFFAAIFGGTWLAGRAIRRRRGRERALILEREEKARRAVLEERTRIARELHDVVAHAISVIVVQARGARHALDSEPDDAREALDAIERTSTQALREMRRLLGMLRSDDEDVALAPQPSLSELDTLVAHVRDAGLPVDVRVEGTPRELAPGVDLSAYRIVQEALTNALKHAGPARARVLVRYGDAALELEVADTGTGEANGDSTGHGLAGMRERVAVFGGELESGPRTEGGYAVRARLPL